MLIFSNIKEIAEAITAVNTAVLLLIGIFKFLPKSVKTFFSETVPVFFKGIFDLEEKKKVRFFKAVKIKKEQKERQKNIIQVISKDFDSEEVLVVNKAEWKKFLLESNLFSTISLRK